MKLKAHLKPGCKVAVVCTTPKQALDVMRAFNDLDETKSRPILLEDELKKGVVISLNYELWEFMWLKADDNDNISGSDYWKKAGYNVINYKQARQPELKLKI